MANDYSKLSKEELLKVVEKLESRKKYGLIWDEERTKEQFEKESENALPVLKKVKGKEIKTDPSKPVNILIEGDNYHALSVLNYTHQGKIDVIYIDPPYNTDNKDFKYNDRWIDKNDSYRHSKWLSFLSKRLRLTKNLLSDSGIIFISIDENEIAQLKILCDEIFGENNFIEQIIWNKRIPKNDKGIGNIHEYVLVYAKNSGINHKFVQRKDALDVVYDLIDKCKRKRLSPEDTERELKVLYEKNKYDRGITLYCSVDEDYKIWGKINLCWPNAQTQGPKYQILHPKTRKPVRIPQKGWRWKKETFDGYLDNKKFKVLKDGSIVCGNIWFGKTETTQPSYIQYLENVEGFLLRSILSIKSSGGMELQNILGDDYGMHPKPVSLIKHLISSCNNNNLILDFFAGSGTTGQAVLEMNQEDSGNRTFILCTNNEVDYKTEKILLKMGTKPGTPSFEKEGICQKICYPRIKNVILGYKNKKGEAEGLGSNLKYLKTAFVKRSISKDSLKVRITRECTEMLCLREGIFDEVKKTDDYRIFEHNDRIMGVYYSLERVELKSLKKDLDKMKGKKILYCFTLDPLGLDKKDFWDWKDVSLEPIPQKILDICEGIYEY